MHPEVFQFFGRAAPVIVLWLMGFVALTVVTLIRRALEGRSDVYRDSLAGGELPGILLVLMHSAAFGYALWLGDWLSVLLFAWWGPGFLVVAGLVLAKRPVDWKRFALFTSVACKLLYVALVIAFFAHKVLLPIYAYSLWIVHDQVRLTWLQHNADRTRRLIEDKWLPRVGYPAFLGLPLFVDDLPLRLPCLVAGAIVGGLWVLGLARVLRRGDFLRRPESFTENLRDIIYLRSQGEEQDAAS